MYFLTVSEARSPRSGRQHDWVLGRILSLAYFLLHPQMAFPQIGSWASGYEFGEDTVQSIQWISRVSQWIRILLKFFLWFYFVYIFPPNHMHYLIWLMIDVCVFQISKYWELREISDFSRPRNGKQGLKLRFSDSLSRALSTAAVVPSLIWSWNHFSWNVDCHP